MEPDILATPSSELADGSTWLAAGKEPAPSAMVENRATTPLVADLPARAPTRLPAGARGAPDGLELPNGRAAPNGRGAAFVSGLNASWGPATGAMSAASAATLAEFELRSAQSIYLRSGKRVMDVVGAALALLVASPVLLLAAIAIKLESHGPVLYRSTRIGRGRRPFTFLKLRSMVNGADLDRHRLSHLNECDGPVFKISRDPRVTRVGRFLRVTSIDEIPQFVNVLLGAMSLVGPRPPIPEEVAQYELWQLHRLDVRPGITCLWQISGRSRIGFQEWMRLDLEYIRRQSFALDLKILLRTIPAVLSREGAY